MAARAARIVVTNEGNRRGFFHFRWVARNGAIEFASEVFESADGPAVSRRVALRAARRLSKRLVEPVEVVVE